MFRCEVDQPQCEGEPLRRAGSQLSELGRGPSGGGWSEDVRYPATSSMLETSF